MFDRYLAVASGWCRSRLLLAEEFSVVALYDCLQVCCAAIRDLQGVTVENFVELVVWGEMFVHECKEFFPYVSGNGSIVWRVIPYYVPLPSGYLGNVDFFLVFKFSGVPNVPHRFLAASKSQAELEMLHFVNLRPFPKFFAYVYELYEASQESLIKSKRKLFVKNI